MQQRGTLSVFGASTPTLAGVVGTFGVVRFADCAAAGTEAPASNPRIRTVRVLIVIVVLLIQSALTTPRRAGEVAALDEERTKYRRAIDLDRWR
jgi:hypothetical protein